MHSSALLLIIKVKMKKRVAILYRNHGRDCTFFVHYTFTTNDFEKDMEILRILEGAWKEDYKRGDEKPPILKDLQVSVLESFFEFCTGKTAAVGWKSFEGLFKWIDERSDTNTCYDFFNVEEGRNLYEKLNTKEMFDYWRSLLVEPHNCHDDLVGDVYIISYSMVRATSKHWVYDSPSTTKEIMDNLARYKKRNRTKEFNDPATDNMEHISF